MITYKIDGLTSLINDLREQNFIPTEEIDLVVKSAAKVLVDRIQDNYTAAGHIKTGNLVNSIEAFKRTRSKVEDPYFTYYVGPRYKGRLNLWNDYGNHAHFLEFGVMYSAYPVTGLGKTINGRKYGKFQTKQGYRIAPTGIIRKSADQVESKLGTTMKQQIVKAIIKQANKKGFTTT